MDGSETISRNLFLADYSVETLRREIMARESRRLIKIPDLLPEDQRDIQGIIETTEWLMDNVKNEEFDEAHPFGVMESCIKALYGEDGLQWFNKYHAS